MPSALRSLPLLLLLALPLAAIPAFPSQKPVQVLVVVSHDAPPYQEALSGFRRTLERTNGGINLQVVQLHGDPERARQLLTQPGQSDLVLTLGSLATRESLRRIRATPTVACMILSPEELSEVSNATGVYLQFPVETELEWLVRLVPSLRRVGIIYSSAEAKARVARAQRAAPSVNLSIQAYEIDGPQQLPDALANLVDRADVLWSVTDPVVYNSETAKSLMVFSFRHHIPLIGYSAPWVKAGALYALERDYTDIGAQCAEKAEKTLSGRAPSSLPPVPPRKVRYVLNRKTAEQMKLDLPERAFREAAEVAE